jgi:NTE family protein
MSSSEFPLIKRPRVALVLGSGGLKCAASLGLWRVLQREKISIDMVVGCSGGSLFAATIALGLTAESIEEYLRRGWTHRNLTRYQFSSLLQLLLPRWFGFERGFGLLDDRGFKNLLKEVFGDLTFGDTKIPLYITATDMSTGEKVVLEEGKIFDAVRSSIAIPIVFRPWRVGNRWLIDGGASDPLPVSVAIREGCEIIIAMGFENPTHPAIDGIFSLVGQTTTILINNLLQSNYAFYNLAQYAEILPIIPSFDRRIGLADTQLIPYIMEQGELAAEEQIPYLKRLLSVGTNTEESLNG